MTRHRDRRFSFTVAVVVAILGGAADAASLEVKTAQGPVVGELAADGLRVYRGIPYAAPPVGDLRWRDPQPPARWSGVRDATRFGARCMQSAATAGANPRLAAAAALPISEDCLYLNVWTGAQRANERRPVIVWIHGGTFFIGTGAVFDGTALSKRGVILVTVNYRLNAFGLFAHPALTAESKGHASGNYAIADVRAALAWVRRNIAAFGGDPKQITLAGQSAGGRIIQSLRTSPCARGLFRRAIIHSAPIRIVALRTRAEAERDGVAAAEKLAAPSLAQLRALPAQKVLEDIAVGQPVIDGDCIQEDSLQALASGRTHDVDLLVGSNSEEGNFPFLRAREYGVGFTSATDYLAYVRDRFGDETPAFLQMYRPASDAALDPAQRAAFADEMAWLARFSASAHARSRGHTFLYLFSHRPPPPATGPDRGAMHGAEISFAHGTPQPNWRDEDRRVADMMSSYWANFAARGDPNGPGLPEWPAFTAENASRMNLGPMSPDQGLDAQRVAVFDALFRRVYGRSPDPREGE
jgi:para-nitrobenzyl esterase